MSVEVPSDNPEYLIIWNLFAPVGTGLKEIYRILKTGFSTVVNIQINTGNTPNLNYDLRHALAVTKPHILHPVKQKWHHPSHLEIHLRNVICDVFTFSE